jgi:hypothetical protein
VPTNCEDSERDSMGLVAVTNREQSKSVDLCFLRGAVDNAAWVTRVHLRNLGPPSHVDHAAHADCWKHPTASSSKQYVYKILPNRSYVACAVQWQHVVKSECVAGDLELLKH